VSAEGTGPAFGRELVDGPMRIRRESKEHVFQVRERWHVDEFAALDQRVEQGGAPGVLHAAREEPVLPAHRDDTQLVFRAIVVNGKAPIVDIALQSVPLVREIAHGVAQRDFGNTVLASRSRSVLSCASSGTECS